MLFVSPPPLSSRSPPPLPRLSPSPPSPPSPPPLPTSCGLGWVPALQPGSAGSRSASSTPRCSRSVGGQRMTFGSTRSVTTVRGFPTAFCELPGVLRGGMERRTVVLCPPSPSLSPCPLSGGRGQDFVGLDGAGRKEGGGGGRGEGGTGGGAGGKWGEDGWGEAGRRGRRGRQKDGRDPMLRGGGVRVLMGWRAWREG